MRGGKNYKMGEQGMNMNKVEYVHVWNVKKKPIALYNEYVIFFLIWKENTGTGCSYQDDIQ